MTILDDILKNEGITPIQDDTFTVVLRDTDSPEMKKIKEAILAKHIDFSKYEARIGPDYHQGERLLKPSTIDIKKFKAFTKDLNITVTLKDETKVTL